MKKLLFLLSALISIYTNAQKWDSVGAGTSFASGQGNGVFALTTFTGSLYAGGGFVKAGGKTVHNMAQWNGVSWSGLDSGLLGVVSSLCVFSGKLYAGGSFDTVSGQIIHNIASWDGTKWDSLAQGIKGIWPTSVSALTVYNGELYACGAFIKAGGVPVNNIAKWNGSSWSPVGSGISFGGVIGSAALAMCVYNGELYVAGMFDSAGGIPVNNIAKWDGSSWSVVGNGFCRKGGGAAVWSMCLYNGKLYTAGVYDSAGAVKANDIASWDGSNWAALGNGLPPTKTKYQFGLSLYVYDSALCIGGIYDTLNHMAANNIGYWDGTNWGTFSTGLTYSGNVFTMWGYNSRLFVGGSFSFAGGVKASNIAQWVGPLMAVNNISDDEITSRVYPNPGDGIFNITTGKAAVDGYIEVYDDALGRVLLKQPIEKGSRVTPVDLSNRATGIYIYSIISDKGERLSMGKIIKQ